MTCDNSSTNAGDAPGYEPLVGSFFTRQLIFSDRPKGFRYLANAKAGSSAVKRFLIGQVQNLADLSESFFPHGGQWTSHILGGDEANRPFTFTVVRNPYGRILSAYLDKIRRPGILRTQFLLQHGLPLGKDVSFREFLECLSRKPAILDQHYRPQVQNIYYGYLDIDAIWPLEDLDTTLADLAARFGVSFVLPSKGGHTTGAGEKIKKHFDDACIEIARDLYREDFRRLGYSDDIDRVGAVIAPVYDIPAFEPGWFGLLAADTGQHAPSECPASASPNLQFYTDVVSAARAAYTHRDPGRLIALREDIRSVEKEHFVLTHLTSLPQGVLQDDILQHALDRLVSIAPFVPGHRMRKIAAKLFTNDTENYKDALRLAEEAKKTTWRSDDIDRLLETSPLFKTVGVNQLEDDDMDLPKITDDLVRFTAIRLAEMTFKEWKEQDETARKRFMEQARVVLNAERRFIARQREEAETQTL